MTDDFSRRAYVPRHARQHITRWSRFWRSPFTRAALVLVAVVCVAGAWVGGRAWQAKGELEQAQALVSVAKAQVGEGSYAEVPATFGQIGIHTAKARSLTQGPLWSAAENLPFAGPNLQALREMAEIVDDTIVAAEPLVALAPQFTPERLAPTDGRVPLEPFEHAAEVYPPFAEDFASLRTRLADVPTAGTLPQVKAAKATLTELFDKSAQPVADAVPIVQVMPELLGGYGPRTYVVMFQNSAEPRSLGGSALSFSEVSVERGAIELSATVPAGFEEFPFRSSSVIAVPRGFDDIYPEAFGRFIANATLRPSSETAAQIIEAEWKNKYDKNIDGVISMDGPALSYLLAAVGPVRLSTGDEVSSANVVHLLFNEVYQRYNSGDPEADNLQQNVIYTETVQQTFGRLTSGAFAPMTLFQSMRSAAEGNHVSVWLASPAEQAAMESTAFAAKGLPESTATADVVGIYLNDQVGSKLGYYLSPTVTSSAAQCTPEGRQVDRVELALTNTLDPAVVEGLSPSIVGTDYDKLGLERGMQRYVMFAYLPPGSKLLSTTVDGVPIEATGQNDEGHPVQVIWTKIPPGGTSVVTVDILLDHPGVRELQVELTPTIQEPVRNTGVLDCATVMLP